MSNYILSMTEEHKQLEEKINKIREFFKTDTYSNLSSDEKSDLIEQLGHMQSYSDVLSRRYIREIENQQ